MFPLPTWKGLPLRALFFGFSSILISFISSSSSVISGSDSRGCVVGCSSSFGVLDLVERPRPRPREEPREIPRPRTEETAFCTAGNLTGLQI